MMGLTLGQFSGERFRLHGLLVYGPFKNISHMLSQLLKTGILMSGVGGAGVRGKLGWGNSGS